MGNCCGCDDSLAVDQNAFKGEGQRLGAKSERYHDADVSNARKNEVSASLEPAPIHKGDLNLTMEEQEQQRAERAAAAELRLKKQGAYPPKKKKPSKDTPLVGPNSKPLMTWTAG
ncbi:hypothetical protein MPSEU_000496000 [Mayamaea pseudoterrestris]|nr:hypothetical protein MPSEU_000494900 [Mayamaea pseudoterrestris]GKY95342.1 hypothetical protein MPSEU_000496000 [Mayamaea pseudoterrestris]